MKAKITEKIICIPPYISTSWDRVTFMQTEGAAEGELTLVLHLDDGKCLKIQNLDKALIDLAFSAHLQYLESKNGSQAKANSLGFLQNFLGSTPEQLESMPIKFGISGVPGLENFEAVMQHNSTQADAEDLPSEVLEKIGQMTKMIGGGDLNAFPKPEPHCNCPHCQLARAVHGIEKEDVDPVSDEDLKFRDWEIQQNGENLYTVTNPLDSLEQYNVFLGQPVGCTCGKEHCEHIKAVLLN
ncbi:MAG: hypothetical protein S4CHLAM45_02690 [Chlamydiales bacterium]|nr:hypothetical protein [Chlamydiales bacterium]MCH9619127.1 hypothetical protein [Chlamydiales bacterium]MCH9622389.1 hypothetical protein [Chlamydiales bacterium]